VAILITALGFQKLIRHENNQDAKINQIVAKNDFLEEKLNQTVDYYNYQTKYADNAYNYLAIGNSLTLIKSWGRGICSTTPDNDYFHLVVKSLEENKGSVISYPYNFAPWERSSDRESTYSLIDVFLSDKLNLVTIQLGENVVDFTTYKDDLIKLVEYVHKKAPKAQIIIIGDFWDKKKNELRKQAAEESGSEFADMSQIIEKKEYQSKEGTECALPDGATIKVPLEAETHPGDSGMSYIANQVIAKIHVTIQ
jgi:hypothetical protein